MTSPAPKFILVHTNKWGEKHFFRRFGEHWPHNPERRLISHTTADRDKAVRFDTYPEALGALAIAGEPPEWEAVVE